MAESRVPHNPPMETNFLHATFEVSYSVSLAGTMALHISQRSHTVVIFSCRTGFLSVHFWTALAKVQMAAPTD